MDNFVIFFLNTKTHKTGQNRENKYLDYSGTDGITLSSQELGPLWVREPKDSKSQRLGQPEHTSIVRTQQDHYSQKLTAAVAACTQPSQSAGQQGATRGSQASAHLAEVLLTADG